MGGKCVIKSYKNGLNMYWVLIFSLVLFWFSYVTGQVETEEDIGQLIKSIATDQINHENACDQQVSQIEYLDYSEHFNGTAWNLLLTCTSLISKSFTELSWHYQGKRLVSDRNSNRSTKVIRQTLRIENVSQLQLGEYTCLSTNCAGYAHESIQPQILPILTVRPSVGTPNEARTRVEANCTSFPHSQLYWKVMENERKLDTSVEIQNAIDQHNNVISSLTFFLQENNTLIHLYCCIQKSYYLDQNTCSSVYIPVYSQPKLISYQTSFNKWNTSLVTFSCNFTGFPLPNQMLWIVCPFDSENCNVVTNESKTDIMNFYVETRLTIIAMNNTIYTCSASNYKNQTSFYDFKLNQLPLPKSMLTSKFTINGSESDLEAVFECKFNDPSPFFAYWIKRDWNGEERIVDDNNQVFFTNATSTNSNDKYYWLKIRPFTNNYYATYYCQIVNDLGYFRSSPLTPFFSSNSDTNGVQIISNSSVCEENEVYLTCISDGTNFLPGEMWKVTIVSEFSLNYTSITGNGWINLSIVLNDINDYIYIQCELMDIFPSQNKTRNRNAMKLLNNCSDEIRLVSTKHCRPDDFLNGNSCDLICTVHKPSSSVLKGHYWIYFSMMGNNSYYLLTENSSTINISPYQTNYTLSLSTYYAGHYQCFSTYFDFLSYFQLPVSYLFKIDPEESGSQLNEECDNHTSCLAYNSVCDERTYVSERVCQCREPLNIPMALNFSTSACVGPVEAGEFCYNNMQCGLAEFNYNCTDNQCVCDAFLVQVEERGGEYRCENSVSNGGFCSANVQCQLFDKKSNCNNDTNTCECVNGYELKDYQHSCGPTKVLSGGAIAGVVIGCVAALVLLGFFCMLGRDKWNFRRNRILGSQNVTLDEEDLEEEMDFPQFNSFTQFPEFQDDDEA